MLSKKTRYAMLAMVRLAAEYGKGPVLISDIAKSENIPQRFLEAILLECKKTGTVRSRVGKSGGYYLIKEPAKIKLGSIIIHFEGGIGMMPCVSETAYQPCEFCRPEEVCKIRTVFLEVRDDTITTLMNKTLSELI